MIVIANIFPKLRTLKDLVKKLSRKRRFRTSFDSLDVNGCETLVKTAWEQFYYIFWLLWRKSTGKISPLLDFEMLEVFVNRLTADENYPFRYSKDLQFPIQTQISLKKTLFLNILFHLWNLHQILNILEKKMIVIAHVFTKLKTVQTWFDHSLKGAVSEHPLALNMLKSSKHLWNLHEGTFITFLITVIRNNLENISLIEVWYLRRVC